MLNEKINSDKFDGKKKNTLNIIYKCIYHWDYNGIYWFFSLENKQENPQMV